MKYDIFVNMVADSQSLYGVSEAVKEDFTYFLRRSDKTNSFFMFDKDDYVDHNGDQCLYDIIVNRRNVTMVKIREHIGSSGQ